MHCFTGHFMEVRFHTLWGMNVQLGAEITAPENKVIPGLTSKRFTGAELTWH